MEKKNDLINYINKNLDKDTYNTLINCMNIEKNLNKDPFLKHIFLKESKIDDFTDIKLDLIIAEIKSNPSVPFPTVDEDGIPFIHKFAALGEIDVVQIILAQGVDPTLQDPYGRTPLYVGLVKGQHRMVEFLKNVLPDEQFKKELEDFFKNTPSMNVMQESNGHKKSLYDQGKSLVKKRQFQQALNKFFEACAEYATSGTAQEANLHNCAYHIQKIAFLTSIPSYKLPTNRTSYSAAEILASKTFFAPDIPQRFNMKSIYENLMKDPFLKLILQTAALFDNPNFHIALLNDSLTSKYKKSIETSSPVGHYNNYNTIAIAANRPFPKMIGTLIHELTHYVMQKLYHNDINPYRRNDKKTEQAFDEAIRYTLCNMLDEKHPVRMKDKTIQEIGQELFSNPNALCDPVKSCFAIFGPYKPKEYHAEFAARLPQAIVANGHSPLLQPLMTFFEQYVVPDMKHLLARYPTNYRLAINNEKSSSLFVERLQESRYRQDISCSPTF
jgi:hypothetical protein